MKNNKHKEKRPSIDQFELLGGYMYLRNALLYVKNPKYNDILKDVNEVIHNMRSNLEEETHAQK